MRNKFKQKTTLTSLTRAEASRINGAKSCGPVTEEGKRASSQNRVTHGFYSHNLAVLEIHREEFAEFELDLWNALLPRDGNEQEIVNRIVAAKWRLRLIGRFETEIFNDQLESGLMDDLIKEPKEVLSPYARQAAYIERSLEKANKELDGYRKAKSIVDRQLPASTIRTRETSESTVTHPPTQLQTPEIQNEPERSLPDVQPEQPVTPEPAQIVASETNKTKENQTNPTYSGNQEFMTREEQQAFQRKQESAYYAKRGLVSLAERR